MSNYTAIRAKIQQYVRTNGNREITGAKLQEILLGMIDSDEIQVGENENRFTAVARGIQELNTGYSSILERVETMEYSTTETNTQNELRFRTVENKVVGIDDRLLVAENKIIQIEKGSGGGLTINAIEKGDSGWNIDTKGRTYSTMNISADTEVAITTADSVASGYEHYLLLWNSGSESVDVAFGYKVGDVPTVIIGESSTVSIDAGGYVEVSVLKVPNYGLVMTMSSGLKGSN